MSFFSAVKYTLTEPITDPVLTITFPYLDLTDLRVYKEIPAVPPETEPTYDIIPYGPGLPDCWELLSPTQIKINASLVPGEMVWIRRYTRRDQRLAEYFDGSTLTEEDLNSVTLQLLYLIQEILDAVGIGNVVVGGAPGGGGGGGAGGPNPTIQDIIDALLATQLFQDLIALIDLVDINAEAIMQNTLQIHERWSQQQLANEIIRQLDAGLEAIDARVLFLEDVRIDDNSATAQLILGVQARLDSAEADLVQLFTATANLDSALTQYIALASSRFDDNEARIFTVETTYASQSYVQAQITTELNTRFAPAELTGYLNATSVIQGLLASSNASGSSVSGITSYIAGSGVTINPDGTINWPATYANAAPGSLARSLATVQTTVDAHATQLSVEAAFRQALAARFIPALDPNLPGSAAPFVAAIEQSWQVYADEESATASLATQLAVNRQPIFFRATAPDPYNDPEFNNIVAGWPTNGFPNGTLWFKEVAGAIRPFYWDADRLVPPDPAPDEFYGPFAVNGTNRPGMWLPNRDSNLESVLGARIDNYASTAIFSNSVEAIVENTLTTVFDAPDFTAVNTIAERLNSYINADTGTMYSSWNVRINQYLGNGTPAIAGVGLGMQSDLLNPQNGAVSQFLVMASQFAVISPPAPGDPQGILGGNLDPVTVQVPFIVDTVLNRVIINGDLFARSFKGLDAFVGRLTVTDMDTNTWAPIDANGMRLVLPSNTNGWNDGVGLSPFTGGPQKFLIWAGSGDMGNNNAVFYVDTDGNARFTGEVVADNIVGTVNDTQVLDLTLPTVLTSNGLWVELGPPVALQPNGLVTRRVVAMVAVALFGEGSTQAEARLQMRTVDPNTGDGIAPYPSFVTVAQSTTGTGTGTTMTLIGSLPQPVSGQVELSVAFRRFGGSGSAESNRYNGIIMGVR